MKTKKTTYTILIPFMLGVFLLSCQEVSAQQIETELENATSVEQEVEPDIKKYINVDIQPKVLNMATVQKEIGYPKIAVAEGIQGQVIVRVLVDEEGKHMRHVIIHQVHPILSEAVEAHVEELKFEPALKNNIPVKFWINLPFNFKLLDKNSPVKKKNHD